MKNAIPRVSCRLVLKEENIEYCDDRLDGPEAALEIVKPLLQTMDKECFICVNLDIKLRPINWEIISIGGTSAAQVEISNCFKAAILSNASRIMVFHNHPSGDIEPSDEDIKTTEMISRAGTLLGLPLIDHMIIAGDRYYSFYQNGKI